MLASTPNTLLPDERTFDIGALMIVVHELILISHVFVTHLFPERSRLCTK